MVRVLSEEEAIALQRKAFNRLVPGMLVSMYVNPDQRGIPVRRYFLTRERVSEISWSMLPLTMVNNLHVVGLAISGNMELVTKEFSEMRCLEILGDQ